MRNIVLKISKCNLQVTSFYRISLFCDLLSLILLVSLVAKKQKKNISTLNGNLCWFSFLGRTFERNPTDLRKKYFSKWSKHKNATTKLRPIPLDGILEFCIFYQISFWSSLLPCSEINNYLQNIFLISVCCKHPIPDSGTEIRANKHCTMLPSKVEDRKWYSNQRIMILSTSKLNHA